MKHTLKVNENSRKFTYQWKVNNNWNIIHVETNIDPVAIEPDSEAEFITEHYFGYTKINENATFEYQVTHPRWLQYKVINNESVIDFEGVYGKEFAFIKDLQPTSVFLAIGSKITIEDKRKLQM
jgi:hypothetical protein